MAPELHATPSCIDVLDIHGWCLERILRRLRVYLVKGILASSWPAENSPPLGQGFATGSSPPCSAVGAFSPGCLCSPSSLPAHISMPSFVATCLWKRSYDISLGCRTGRVVSSSLIMNFSPRATTFLGRKGFTGTLIPRSSIALGF
jgi:hypothetical protein